MNLHCKLIVIFQSLNLSVVSWTRSLKFIFLTFLERSINLAQSSFRVEPGFFLGRGGGAAPLRNGVTDW